MIVERNPYAPPATEVADADPRPASAEKKTTPWFLWLAAGYFVLPAVQAAAAAITTLPSARAALGQVPFTLFLAIAFRNVAMPLAVAIGLIRRSWSAVLIISPIVVLAVCSAIAVHWLPAAQHVALNEFSASIPTVGPGPVVVAILILGYRLVPRRRAKLSSK
jgi:hypothetical protein